jgi:uncharacterized protein
MSASMHTASVAVFQQMLGGLKNILAKSETHATEKKIDAEAFLRARLSPDMFPLIRQVQIACDFAKGVSARLAGVEVPAYEDNEQTFAELQARLDKTLAFISSLPTQAFDDSAMRQIVLRPGTPKERTMLGQAYLFSYGLPQFFFHVTTAYALLRHNGIAIGKGDYMGAY